MTILSAEEILLREFRGQANILTPHIVEIGKVHPRVAYELSKGKAGEFAIWGATFAGANEDGTTWRACTPDFSSCFMSRGAAEAHILRVQDFLVCAPTRPKSMRNFINELLKA